MSDEVCCAMAKKLGAKKLGELDAELRTPNHRAYRKLAAELGVRHNAIERHKKGCLRLGEAHGRAVQTFVVPETSDLPPVRRRPPRGAGTLSHVSHGTEPGTAGVPDGTTPADGTAADLATRARAPESENPAERRKNRVIEIVAAMADGTWDTPRDNAARRAKEWGVSRATVEDMVREASVGATVDPESVQARRAVAMGRWGWGVERARKAIEAGPEFPDTMSKLLASYAQMQAGWDKAAGVTTEGTTTINIAVNPVFVAASEAIFAALAPFPEAAAAARKALAERLSLLRQSPMGGPQVITVASEGAAA